MIAANASDVISLASDGVLTWISPSVTEALGGRPEDWIGVRLAERVHPDDMPSFVAAVTDVDGGRRATARFRFRGMDDDFHWVDVRVGPFIDAAGRINGDIAIVRVVDAEVAAQLALSESEERYRLLTENAYDVIWTMDSDGVTTYVCPSVERVRGLIPAAATAQTL